MLIATHEVFKFYKDKLPFTPSIRQVVYFDVSAISMKMGHRVARMVDSNYEYIYNMFSRAGLEFCFLPRMSSKLNIYELYKYFRPDATDDEIKMLMARTTNTDWSLEQEADLARYAVEGSSLWNDSRPGLIRYMGKEFDRDATYYFSYMEFGNRQNQYQWDNPLDANLYMRQLESYIDLNRVDNTDVVEDDYGAADDVDELMSEAQLLISRIRRNGVDEMVLRSLFHPTQELSRLKIHGNRIFLTDYQNLEIRMGPLPKTVYFLYLRHPEGIAFSDMENHYDELLRIYRSITGRENEQEIRNSILDLTIPENNSLNEKCSRIRQAFVSNIDDAIARNYYVTGERGGKRRITLPQEMVVWENTSLAP